MAMWNLSGLWSEDKEGRGGVARDLAAIQAIPRLAVTVNLLHPSIGRWPLICANVLTVNWALTCACTVCHAVRALASISLTVNKHTEPEAYRGRSSQNKGKHTFVSGHTMKVTQQIKLGIVEEWKGVSGKRSCCWVFWSVLFKCCTTNYIPSILIFIVLVKLQRQTTQNEQMPPSRSKSMFI